MTLHAADCGVWDALPGEAPEALALAGADPANAAYLSQIAPLYRAAVRVLGQLSGVLVLAMTTGRGTLSLDHRLYASVADQLAEARGRLAEVRAPAAAARHHETLAAVLDHLDAAAQALDRVPTTLAPATRAADTRTVVARLHAAQRLVVAAAVPGANITPVDLSNACCSCGRT
jgi:hypothetical protein